uniref:Small nuclear RNA activating complex polypeptide 4 n=1 Tax=Cercocebus atys TaxID=9531 RepID=A0A2K5N0R4_CERAT
MDVDAEREKITQEIKELERILDPSSAGTHVEVSESSLESDSEAESLPSEDLDPADPLISEEERWGEASNDEDDPKDKTLPEDPETCLQLNMVYQEVIQEKLAEANLLLAQNREQQEELMRDLAGSKGTKVKDGRSLPPSTYMGHFMKPYFKDKVTGVGPPANEDTREKAAQGIKAFEELLVTKWKNWEKALLRKSVVSDRLQRLLQPKLLKLEYLHQKQSKVSSEMEKQALEKQAREAEKEIQDINQLPEEALLGNRLDSHDWEKISNINTSRSAFQCLQKFQQRNKALKRKEWTEEEDYLRRLHFSLKKGRWNLKEEEQLIELIGKYGVGHWAKIASELPHRSGSQCLSKWKIMMGKKQGLRRRRRRARHSIRWSSSSSSSSSGSGGSGRGSSSSSEEEEPEPEQAQAGEGDRALLSPQYVVPDMDLWVPARQSTSQPWRGGAGAWLGGHAASLSPPKGSSASQGGSKEASATAAAPGEETSAVQARATAHSPVPRAAQASHSADTHPVGAEKQALEGGRLTVPVETVLRVLRANTAARSRTQKEQLRQPPLPTSSPGVSSGDSVARSHVQWLRHRATQSGQRRWRHALHRRLLNRRLLLAVTPWVGDVVLPCTQVPQRPAAVQTQADGLREQLQQARLASTPVFTLFTQLFQIDTAGCLEVVRERKALPPRLPQAGARDPPMHLLQAPSSAQSTPGHLFPNVPAQEASKSASHKGSRRLASSQVEGTLPQASPLAPTGPRPKPKTVSELLQEKRLQEKRLQEARAREATQGPVVLPSHLLVSPVILQPPLPHTPHSHPALGPTVSNVPYSGPGTPAEAKPGTSGSWQEAGPSAKDKRLSTMQALPLAPAFTGPEGTAPAASGAPGLGPSQVSVSCPGSGLGQSQAPTASRKQSLPEASPFLPAAPSPTPLPIQPLSLTHVGGPRVAASVPLPVTWVLTAQGLLPVPVPAVVGLSSPAGTPGPTGLVATLLPPLTEAQAAQGPGAPALSSSWQPPANVNSGPEPSCGTVPPAPPTHAASRSPAEVDASVAVVPGEAQVAREIPAPRTSSQADPPEAEPPLPRRLPPLGGVIPASEPGGTLGSPSGTQEPKGTLDLEKPPLPQPGPEKGALDLGLLSQEAEAATQQWLGGQRGVRVRLLGSRLPYQPPALCSLRALSSLLLHKKALEHKAASLVAGGEAERPAGALQASLGLVRGQLRDNAAYLLLRARFLAAFTLPALLATLAPHGVRTTLSAVSIAGSESEDEDLLSELELADRDGQPGCTAATRHIQGPPDSGRCSAASCLDAFNDLDVDDLDVLRTRHARHTRKRRRLV